MCVSFYPVCASMCVSTAFPVWFCVRVFAFGCVSVCFVVIPWKLKSDTMTRWHNSKLKSDTMTQWHKSKLRSDTMTQIALFAYHCQLSILYFLSACQCECAVVRVCMCTFVSAFMYIAHLLLICRSFSLRDKHIRSRCTFRSLLKSSTLNDYSSQQCSFSRELCSAMCTFS